MLFKVTNFSTNGKPIRDFLCSNNSNLPPIVHHFRDMYFMYYYVLCITVRAKSLSTERFGLKKLEISLHHMVQSIFRHLEPFRGDLWV